MFSLSFNNSIPTSVVVSSGSSMPLAPAHLFLFVSRQQVQGRWRAVRSARPCTEHRGALRSLGKGANIEAASSHRREILAATRASPT